MRITIQEEILSVKPACERSSSTFGIKIKIHHEENGWFSEQPFRSAIEDFDHAEIFCGVGSHHQNVIVEKKFKL